MSESIIELDPSELDDSPLNPRKTYPQPSIDEMAESIKANGVIEPLVVRKKPNGEKGYELVVGHRRKRGAIQARIGKVPCIVKEMNDDEVIETQLIENAQRENVHPMEEALAFEQLSEHGHDVAALAAKVAKSESYIYSRMRLLKLVPDVRTAFLEGQIDHPTALAIARVHDPNDQLEALRYATDGNYFDGRPSAKAVMMHIERSVMLRIADAPWDPTDPGLDPMPCASCPKLTGNEPQASMFDVDATSDKGLCTDRACHANKMEQFWARASEEHKQAGGHIPPKKEMRKLFDKYTGLKWESPYVDLDRTSHLVSGVTYREMLGEDLDIKKTVLARDPHTGHIHFLYDKTQAESVAKKYARLQRQSSTATEGDRKFREKQRKEREQRKMRQGVIDICIRHILGDPAFAEERKGVTVNREDEELAIALMMLEHAILDGDKVAKSLGYEGDDPESTTSRQLVGARERLIEALLDGKEEPFEVIRRLALATIHGRQEYSHTMERVFEIYQVPFREIHDKNEENLKERWKRRAEGGTSRKKNGNDKSKKSKSRSRKKKGNDDSSNTPGPDAAILE